MQVANAFIKRSIAGKLDGLTPMKLQKLMFFAQSWYLKKYQKTLIEDTFVRWQYGPVIPSIYYEFARAKGDVIVTLAVDAFGEKIPADLSDLDEQFLDKIVEVYGGYSGWQLSEMTHHPDGAWAMNNKLLGSTITLLQMVEGAV